MDNLEKAEHERRTAEVSDEARKTLRDRGIYDAADEPLLLQYGEAIATAEYLSRELRLFAPESQDYRRLSAARDRAQRTAGSLATKLRLTARSRPKPPKSTDFEGALAAIFTGGVHEEAPEAREAKIVRYLTVWRDKRDLLGYGDATAHDRTFLEGAHDFPYASGYEDERSALAVAWIAAEVETAGIAEGDAWRRFHLLDSHPSSGCECA